MWYEPNLAIVHHHPLHQRTVPAVLRMVTRHSLMIYAAKHWPAWQFRLLTRIVQGDAWLRRLGAWWSGDAQQGKLFATLSAICGDLRGRSRGSPGTHRASDSAHRRAHWRLTALTRNRVFGHTTASPAHLLAVERRFTRKEEGSAMKRFVLIIAVLTFSLGAHRDTWSQEKVARNVSNEAIEKVLQGLAVKYQKATPADKDAASMYFDFTRGEQPCRLKNYGSDLWLEVAIEKKVRLEDVNRWNAEAKFSRLVLIESKDKTILSLEAQLDCLGGVTEPAIRQFIQRFDGEAKKFAKFVK